MKHWQSTSSPQSHHQQTIWMHVVYAPCKGCCHQISLLSLEPDWYPSSFYVVYLEFPFVHHCLSEMLQGGGAESAPNYFVLLIEYLGLFFFFFFFLGLHPQHMEIPRLGGNWSCSRWPTPQQRQIWATSVTNTRAHGIARSLMHWVRLGIAPASSRMLVRIVSAGPWGELQYLGHYVQKPKV